MRWFWYGFLAAAAAIGLMTMACPAVAAQSVTLAWDASTEPDLAGYRVYYGTAQRQYSAHIDVGNVTTFTINDLADGTYYFAATAYDAAGNESAFSNEVSTDVDGTPPAAPSGLRVVVNVTVEVN